MTEGKAEVREEITEVTETETEAQAAQAKTVSEEEFAALKREIPEIADKDALPAEVLEEAKEQSISLLDAYLRYRMREERYVQAERLRQQRTGEQSAGSLYTGDAPTHPESDAFTRSFASAIQY